jgi:DNA gyrase/topoisomerase IV subunit B
VLNERSMRKALTDLGLDGAELIIRDDEGKELRRVGKEELRKVIDLLGKLEEVVKIVQRRGIDFADVLSYAQRHDRQFPHFHVVENGVKDLDKLFTQLEQYGLLMDDYFLTQEESVSGELLPTKFAILSDEKSHDVAGVAQILPTILAIGKTGIEIKRFKGLGEMNSEQLWETTLDPGRRVLQRVTLEEVGEAERLFSVLMGEDVERRRQFIEDHALEVKNLDV